MKKILKILLLFSFIANSQISTPYWSTQGITANSSHWFGTRNNQPLVFKINNTEVFKLTSTDATFFGNKKPIFTINGNAPDTNGNINISGGGGGIALTDLSATSPLTYNSLTGVFALPNVVTGTGTATQVPFFSSASQLTSTSEFVYNNTSKSLGVGTNPSTTLHVQNPLNATNTINANAQILRLSRPQTVNSKWDNIAQFNLGSYSGSTVSATSRLDLALNDGAGLTQTNVMTWQANANVGINTTAPTEKLDVVGNIKFSGALMPNNSAGTAGQVLVSSGTGNAPVWQTIAGATPYTAGDGISISGSNVVSVNAWVFYVNQWSVVPTVIATITGVPAGDVWQYTYKGVTRYRFVPTTYDPTIDAFYSSWNANTSTLSGLIATRG